MYVLLLCLLMLYVTVTLSCNKNECSIRIRLLICPRKAWCFFSWMHSKTNTICQSYEIKSPPWTILWFRILRIFPVENIDKLGVFMFQTWGNSQLCIDSQYSSQYLTIWSLKHQNTKHIYIFNKVRVLHLNRLKEGTWLLIFGSTWYEMTLNDRCFLKTFFFLVSNLNWHGLHSFLTGQLLPIRSVVALPNRLRDSEMTIMVLLYMVQNIMLWILVTFTKILPTLILIWAAASPEWQVYMRSFMHKNSCFCRILT